jgi:hypothetical protein
MPPTARRLADLLIDPHETLDVEHKEWIDLVGNNDHKATLAKALIALANHGGGFLIFGLAETAQGVVAASNRPADLSGYTPDSVNAAVAAYAEPSFHCDLSVVAGPDGSLFPIASVPGGHHVPIRAKREGPNGLIVKQNSYYIRRPGPQSEIPQTGREWDALIRRCLSNAREELLDQMRGILRGDAANEPSEDEFAAATRWLEESLARWQQVVAGTPPDSSARFPGGHFAVAYLLSGNLTALSAGQVLEALHRGKVPHTGWPEFLVPSRVEIRPYIQDGNVECWIGRDGGDHGPAHSDFWRVSTGGKFFIIRGHQEDDGRHGEARTAFDITLPTWRLGEALLHAANMAAEFGDPAAQITILVEWTGLAGRALTHLERTHLLFDHHRAQQDVFRNGLVVQADKISEGLPELVARLIVPLYELFDFFRLPAALPAEELARMRANRFCSAT